MAINRGKGFESQVKENFLEVLGASVDRLHDQMTGFAGSTNICDFIVYKKPFQYYIECKSVHGNTLSIFGTNPKRKYGDITNNQWEGLLEKSRIDGVLAGILCWWVDHDVTKFIPIQCLQASREFGTKSIRYDVDSSLRPTADDNIIYYPFTLVAKKKRVFSDYDMRQFFIEGEQILKRGECI